MSASRPRVHCHSDCWIYGGSETMLTGFFNDPRFLERFDVSFSYRFTPEYETGFRAKVWSADSLSVHPLPLSDLYTFYDAAQERFGRAGRLAARVLGNVGLVKYVYLRRNTAMLERLLRELAPDILHVNSGGFPGANSISAAVLAARRAGIRRIVYVANNVATPYSRPARWLDRPVDRRVADAVSVFVTGSEYAGGELREMLRLSSGRQVTIPNGVAGCKGGEGRNELRRRLGIPADRYVVAMVALLERRKGHLHLLRALATLKAEDPASMPFAIIAGEGPERGVIEAFVAANGIAADVRLVGAVPSSCDYLAAADVLCVPSVANEDFPIVVLEAMSLGRPVIGSDFSGIPEQVVDGKTGILVTPGDEAGIAAALRSLRGPELRERLGAAAQERFEERFTLGHSIAAYAALYERLLADQASPT